MFGNCNHCCFCCGHPCTMLGVSLFISCKNKIQCVCVKKKNPQTINAGEGVEKKEPSYTAGENVNWYSHYGEQYGGSLKN